VCSGGNVHFAARQDAYCDPFKRSQPGTFDVIADADPEITALRARLSLSDAKVFIVGERQRTRVALREVAARIDERFSVTKGEADRIRHLFGPDHVAAAQLRTIQIQPSPDSV